MIRILIAVAATALFVVICEKLLSFVEKLESEVEPTETETLLP